MPTEEEEKRDRAASVNITSHNQMGGITAHTVNQAPEPELRPLEKNVTNNPDGTITTHILAEVVAPYPPSSLRVVAWASGIVALSVAPQRAGMHMAGHCGTRADHAFHTLMSPMGRYMISVQTKEPTNPRIEYQFDG